MLIEVLAVLSASAAAGMRIGLPLLIIGLLQQNLWSETPILSKISPQVVIGVLTSWSMFELFGSKQLLGQRVIQLIQLVLSPLVGALMAITVLKWMGSSFHPMWIMAVVGGLLAFVLKMVQVGWFFRLRGLPLWLVFGEDLLCVVLVLYALKAPQNGGLIAIFLLWLAIRSSRDWYRWHQEKKEN